jgi:hypothetical protein
MKIIRRTRRITVRKSELTIVQNGDSNSHLKKTDIHICPLCHSPINSKPPLSATSDEKLVTAEN